jgi:uncharacterized protein (DUF697 family)
VALMQLAGVGVRDILGVVREARDTADSAAPLVVTGMLSSELARALRGGAEEEGSVRVGTNLAGAAALVMVLGGAPTDDDDRLMRAAARVSLPVVAVQTDPRAQAPLAYVPASAVVVCRPGRSFPVEDIGRALAGQLGHDAAALAARVPAFRQPIVRELVREAALRAAVVGALPWRKGADLPALTLIQARLVLDLAAAHGREIGKERATELVAVASAGLGVRALVRRLPRRLPLVGGLTGYLTTRALGEATIKRFAELERRRG